MALLYSSIVLASVVVSLCDNGIDDQGFGLELLRAQDFSNRLVEPPHRGQILGIPLMSGRIVRVEFEGSLERALSSRPVPLIESNPGERVLGLGKRVVKLQGFSRSLLDSCKPFFRRNPVQAPQDVVAISQPGVGESIARIQTNRLLKIIYCFLQSLPGPLVPEVTALQVQLIRLCVFSVPLDEKLPLVACQCKGKRARDPFRNRILQLENVRALIFALITPKRLAVPDVNQPDAHSHRIADLLDAALEDRFDFQVSPCRDRV